MTTGKKAILAASFGTSYKKTREATIGAVERTIAENFPDYEVRRAFTSQNIIRKLKCRDGEVIDNVREAMERLAADGFDTLIVQPTHVMNGFEYEDMMEEIAPYRGLFSSFGCGKPLLSDDKDYKEMVKILAEETADYNRENNAVVFMGHGTGHEANAVYARLEESLKAAGYTNYYIGTVEGSPTVEEVIPAVREGGCDHVVLLPLMIVAGDHACNDMAGDEDSWKTVFTSEGYQVTCVLKGIGEYPGVQNMFVNHVRDAIESKHWPNCFIPRKSPIRPAAAAPPETPRSSRKRIP